MSVYEKVCEVLADYFGLESEELSRETELETDLNADTADLTELAAALEEAFDLSGLTAERMEQAATIEDLCEYISDEVGV